MKYILVILAGVLPCLAFSQLYVKGENINELDIYYITIREDYKKDAILE